MGFIIAFFSAWRAFEILLSLIGKILIHFNNNIHYAYQLNPPNPFIPSFLTAFASYDGVSYLQIARDGYGMYQQAFFPLFPLLIHIVSPFLKYNYFLTGFFIANISFFFGLYFLKKYLEAIRKSRKTIVFIFLFLLTFPTSFFFGAVYTEGLFFLFVTASLYFMEKKAYGLVAVACFFAALTRLMGVFLVIPLMINLFFEQQSFLSKSLAGKIKRMAIISPVLGLFSYMLYLFQTTHNPLAFYHSLSGFHTGRSTQHMILLPQVYYRYITIFLKAQHNFVYSIAIFEFITCTLFLSILLYDLWVLWKDKNTPARMSLIGLNIFSFVNILLPTLTGTLTSVPRYALFSLSFFLRIAEIRSIFVRVTFLSVFVFFHILFLVLFAQGYFIG